MLLSKREEDMSRARFNMVFCGAVLISVGIYGFGLVWSCYADPRGRGLVCFGPGSVDDGWMGEEMKAWIDMMFIEVM